MFHFCFNDCIPIIGSNDQLVSCLSNTIKHYKLIKDRFPSRVVGIITDRYPNDIILNATDFSLSECINYLDREPKRIALSNFGKYPVDSYFDIIDIDNLLSSEYKISIDDIEYDAIIPKITQENGGILFTLPVHTELEKNMLIIRDNKKHTSEVLNQYGANMNTSYITDFIQNDIIKSADGFDKLLLLIGDCAYNSRFKSDFDNLTYGKQKKLLNRINQAIERNKTTRFYPDDVLIKDVTPNRENLISVFELRIFPPDALRMYFYETTKKIYLGSICNKPKPKVQDNEILNATSIIKELIALEGK